MKDAIIIGAGLTGLTIAYLLKKQGRNIVVLEKQNRVGGAIHTQTHNDYIFETGPNTGAISNPEVVELFDMLGLEPETACENAAKRLILKNKQWHPLPCDATSFLKTPLFTGKDKFKIFFEPFRPKGKNPDESVASLAARRIGQSFVDYAVNPFISGIYAGDPERLVTRYALPKLYRLEQNYGSFIGGSFKKSREKKTDRDRKATREVFSIKGGLSRLTDTLAKEIGLENIILSAENISVSKKENYYTVSYTGCDQKKIEVNARAVITTTGAYELPALLPFISSQSLNELSDLTYAKVIQVAVGLKENVLSEQYISFGGLIPQKESRDLLGVLFPSYCFDSRCPEKGAVLAVYMGGIKRPDIIKLKDEAIRSLVKKELKELLQIPADGILFMHVFRHENAIPQYEKNSGKRFEIIKQIQQENLGLVIAGNLRDGIGMADRIKQAFDVVEQLAKDKIFTLSLS